MPTSISEQAARPVDVAGAEHTRRTTLDNLVTTLRARAESLGFDAFGIAAADSRPDLPAKLNAALAAGWHGGMEWMASTAERRARPAALWPDARSVIMLGMSYAPETDPLSVLDKKSAGAISVYARNRDYHEVIKGRLKELAGVLAGRTGEAVKVFVDTAPLMEKPLAQAAGLGWQGKHTVLVSREHGSWLFLGAIVTSAVLPTNSEHVESCGSCTRCLDICPTQAFPAPFQLDARRCIAYLTVEHRGPIPREFRAAIGNRIFGCDDCLAVCPWNKFARQSREAKLSARPELEAPALADLLRLDDESFRATFSGSPVKRLGRERFIRNVLIAAGNSGDPMLLPFIEDLLADSSAVVRGAAVWALGRLQPRRAAALATQMLAGEVDADVREEWRGDVTPIAQ